MNTYYKETVEFQEVVVMVDGSPVTDNYHLAIALGSSRPTEWNAPVTLGDKQGVMIQDLDMGLHTIWVKVTDDPEIPVFPAGSFLVA